MHDIEVSHGNILGSTEWNPSLMDLGTMNSTRAHQTRVLNGQFFFFLIKISMSAGQGGLKKHGTQAHQARVP